MKEILIITGGLGMVAAVYVEVNLYQLLVGFVIFSGGIILNFSRRGF